MLMLAQLGNAVTSDDRPDSLMQAHVGGPCLCCLSPLAGRGEESRAHANCSVLQMGAVFRDMRIATG
jgi:hypothetical protein